MAVKEYISKEIKKALETSHKDIPLANTWNLAHMRVKGKKEFLRRNSNKWETAKIAKREGTYPVPVCVANLTRLFYEAGLKLLGAKEHQYRHFKIKYARLKNSWGYPLLTFKVELFWPHRKEESLEEYKFFFTVEMKRL